MERADTLSQNFEGPSPLQNLELASPEYRGKGPSPSPSPPTISSTGRGGGFGDSRPRVLFLCTGNSCRSQMAEGWARALKSDSLEAHSAGIQSHGLNQLAVRVMAEAGVDITCQRSKHVDELRGVEFDYVIAVCDSAAESCPTFPGRTRMIRHSFDDPPRLARDAATEAEALVPYRRVRDEIRQFVETLPQSLISTAADIGEAI